ncbi:hypothetical protein AcW1_005621 [Taiwanofungus camphoratus]|nr:hypothetical protein AcW1_005621 [Antrodia cinnamomea]
MGNSASSGRGHHEDTVDFGYLTPQGIYTGLRDWNQSIVAQLICERKLAPFYRPLDDYDDSWDDEQILAARKEPADPDGGQPESSSMRTESIGSSASRSNSLHRRGNAAKEPVRHPEAAVYRGAVECPICFLYYPHNINHSRCCDQAICTECFVQIKRADPTTTHLVSEPASCPYCVQENFGIVYTPPPWRAGLGSEGATPPSWPEPTLELPMPSTAKRRHKSFSADSPEVVTIDHIRPDWEAKLAAVRAAVTRRANRRIIMRQVGDRLIPVGVTSGRVHALPTEDAQIENVEGGGGVERGSRRSRRRQQNPDLNQFLGTMGIGGQDLEELMVMEAMRLSLLEHEEQQRREREEEAKKQQQATNGDTPDAQTQSEGAGSPSTEVTPPGTAPVTIIGHTSDSSTSVPASSVSTQYAAPANRTDRDSPLPPTPIYTPEADFSPDSNEPTPEIITTSAPSEDGQRDPSSLPSFSALNAALTVAASTASAVASPSAESLASGETASPPPTNTLSAALSSAVSTASAIASPSAESLSYSSSLGRPASRPRTPMSTDGMNGLLDESYASSCAPSHYDMLSSSPDSAISHKPLLDSRAGTPPVVMVESADASGQPQA